MELIILVFFLLNVFKFIGPVGAEEKYLEYSCPPEGPKLPRPSNLAQSPFIQKAIQNITNSLNGAINGTYTAGWAVQNTSLSVTFLSRESRKPIFEWHYRGDNMRNGSTMKVDGDTQYAIGSLSKLISDIMLMRSGMDLHKPITDYVPDLNSSSSKIKWNEITVASLAEHLAGIPANYGFADHYSLQGRLEELGFPPVTDSDYNPCGVEDFNKRCTKKQILDGMLTTEPISPPNRRAIYSQLAFTISSYALSAFSGGKSYRESLRDLVASPFRLNNTGVSPGDTSRAVVPPVSNWWGKDLEQEAPGSGLYSSSNDLSAIMHSILDRSLLPESTILRWMKPTAMFSTSAVLSGMPWEIMRQKNVTGKYPQSTIWFVKGGSVYGYSSQVALLDQYGIATVILGAGDAFGALLMPSILSTSLIPALEEETRAQAQKRYVKTYTSAGSNSGQQNSSSLVKMNITMDIGPGLIIRNLTRGKYDILAALPLVYQEAFGNLTKLPITLAPIIRMYPTDLQVRSRNAQGREVIREDWRIKWDPVFDGDKWNGTNVPGVALEGDEDGVCGSWPNADWSNYAGQPIEKFVFILDPQTKDVLGVEIPFLRSNLTVAE